MLALVNVSFSQEVIENTNSENLIQLNDALPKEGTYQFIIHLNKGEPAFTTEVLKLVLQNRKQSEDVVINLSENVDLYIPSLNKINAVDFVPLVAIQK